MKREDFKEITKKHIETAEKLIETNGMCENIKCNDCPFDESNNKEGIVCGEEGYATKGASCYEEDEKLLKSAREFLEICGRTETIIREGTVDKSTSIEVSEDKIKSPNHYKLEGLNCETIDVVKARLGKDGFKAFCVGNVLKYVLRAEKKNGLEDYKKSRQYLDWIIEEEEK